MRSLYPEIEPFEEFKLPVGEIHTIHVERCGNPNGLPVVFLHGGPGGGIDPVYRRYFDPQKWHIVLFDQRACGRSTPFSELTENTTWHIVADIEAIRERLGIPSWAVFGGSWGSTLALAYAITHPSRVNNLLLRGIFLGRQREYDWLYQGGAAQFYPDAWQDFVAQIPEAERHGMITAYHRRLTSDDARVRLEAARAWSVWEARTSKLTPDPNLVAKFDGTPMADAFARIEAHYFINRCFFEGENYLLDRIETIRHIPTYIVHGRYDMVCTIDNAWELHKALPHSRLQISQHAGHSLTEKETTAYLVEETDRIAAGR